jgi:hypothetical protein
MRYFIFLSLLAFSACKENQKTTETAQNQLYEEVMAIHDQVMPEMTTILNLKKDLKAIEKPETKDIILQQVKELNDADEAMMTWMAAFKVPEDKTQEEAYLILEKEKIKQVSDLMYASMDRAKKLIDSLQIQNK